MSSINVADGPGRAAGVQYAGYRWAFLFLAFALLVDVAWRSFFWAEAAWDLLVLVMATGVITMGYQACQGTLSRRLDVASPATWPQVRPLAVAPALTTCSAPNPCARSKVRRRVWPSRAMTASSAAGDATV